MWDTWHPSGWDCIGLDLHHGYVHDFFFVRTHTVIIVALHAMHEQTKCYFFLCFSIQKIS
jgi:hypothetical protein